MALRTFVRVSGINNLSDARYCAGMEVDELGFNINADHENYTDPQKFKELAEWVSGVEFIGEITSDNPDLKKLVADYQLDGLQVAEIALIDDAINTGLKVSFVANDIVEAKNAWDASGNKLDAVVLNNSNISNNELKELSLELPLVLTEGFDESNLEELLNETQPKGIALTGGDEIRPGYKDFDELADILELLEIDDLA